MKNIDEVIVILDTPYRLKTLLTDIVKAFGKNKRIVVAFELTMKDERFFRGTAEEILKVVEQRNLKGEFVLMVDNKK